MILRILAIINMLGSGVNLAQYTWIAQDPGYLAAGIFCGFVAIFIVVTDK